MSLTSGDSKVPGLVRGLGAPCTHLVEHRSEREEIGASI
jgi:hypothetical protein